jgi:hypothetical protein
MTDSVTLIKTTEWVRINKEFLKLAFAGGRHEASFPYSRCENRRKLSEYEISAQLTKKGFMLNYLLWHQNGEVQLAVADEPDGNDDVDRMDDMVADILESSGVTKSYFRKARGLEKGHQSESSEQMS